MKPKTSIIIPVRNGARFVAEAIASVLKQAHEDDEVVAVDDGSTDETAAILAGITNRRLRLLSTGGRGVSVARNRGIAESQGAFIAFLDHDDLWPAGRHAALTMTLDQGDGLDAAFGRIARRIEPGARPTAESKVLGHHAPWLVGSGLYRRRLLEQIGGFAENLAEGEDVDFHLRLLEAGMRIGLCEATSLIRRHHDANTADEPAEAESRRLNVLRRKLARQKASAAVRSERG